jgi:hypothetical protein
MDRHRLLRAAEVRSARRGRPDRRPGSRDVALDRSLDTARYGGEGTGPNSTDLAKLAWKWPVASERHGIAVRWVIDGANSNNVAMLEPIVRRQGIDQFEIQRRGTRVLA